MKKSAKRKSLKDTASNNLREQYTEIREQFGNMIEEKPVMSSWKKRLQRLMDLDLGQTAAASSFYFLFSLFPLLLLFFSLLNVIDPHLAQRVERALPSLDVAIPEQVLKIILDFIKGTGSKNSVPLISFTAVGLLWSASKGVGAIVNFMTKVYHSKRNYNFLLKRLLGILAILILSILLIAILLVLSFHRLVLGYLDDFIQLPDFLSFPNFNLTAYFIAFAVLTFIFTITFSILGRRRGYFTHTLISAMITSAAWLLISFGLSMFISRRSDYYLTYGSITGIIFLMLWLYAAIYLVMVGAFIHTEFILMYPRKKKKGSEN